MTYQQGVWVGGRLKANGNQWDFVDWPKPTPSDDLVKMMTFASMSQQWQVRNVYRWMLKSVDVVDSWWLDCQIRS